MKRGTPARTPASMRTLCRSRITSPRPFRADTTQAAPAHAVATEPTSCGSAATTSSPRAASRPRAASSASDTARGPMLRGRGARWRSGHRCLRGAGDDDRGGAGRQCCRVAQGRPAVEPRPGRRRAPAETPVARGRRSIPCARPARRSGPDPDRGPYQEAPVRIGIPRESKVGETLVAATAKTATSSCARLRRGRRVGGRHLADQPDSAFTGAGRGRAPTRCGQATSW